MINTGRRPLTAAAVLDKEVWHAALTSLVGLKYQTKGRAGLVEGEWESLQNPPPGASGAHWHMLCRCPRELLPRGKPQAFPQSHSC